MIRATILVALVACAVGVSFPSAFPLYTSYLNAPSKTSTTTPKPRAASVPTLHAVPARLPPWIPLAAPIPTAESVALRLPPWIPHGSKRKGIRSVSVAAPLISRSHSYWLTPTYSSYAAVHQAAASVTSQPTFAAAVYPYSAVHHTAAYVTPQAAWASAVYPYATLHPTAVFSSQPALASAVYPYAAVHNTAVVVPQPALATAVYPYAAVHNAAILPPNPALASVVVQATATPHVTPAVVSAPAIVSVPTPVVAVSQGSSSTAVARKNTTVVSKSSTQPTVTTTVFRAPGVAATTVHSTGGTSTTLVNKTEHATGVTAVHPKVVVPAYAAAVGAVQHVYPVHVPVAPAPSPAVLLHHVNYLPYGYTVRL